MDTKWLAGAGIAAVVAFAGALWWSTPSSDASAKALTAPTVSKAARSGGASANAAKSRKGGAHAKARSGKGGKAKAGKSAKARGGKAEAGRARAAGGGGPASWEHLRGKVAAGAGGKVQEYGTAHQWDAAKTASVQKVLDDTVAKIDDASARIKSGALQPDAAASEFQALRKNTGKQLVDLLGAEDAKGFIASLKSAGPAPGAKSKAKAPAAN
jgi:hypothetical protein